MNIRILSAVTLATMIAGIASPVLAHDVSVSAAVSGAVRPLPLIRQEVRDDRKDLRDERASKSVQLKAELKTRLTEARKSRLKKWWTQTVRRLNSLVEREKKLATKLSERIDRLAAAGKDVTKPKAALVSAQVGIDAATKAIVDANAQFDVIVANNTPADAFAKLRDLHKGLIAKIREAHRLLVQVALSIRVANGPTPTVTP